MDESNNLKNLIWNSQQSVASTVCHFFRIEIWISQMLSQGEKNIAL